MFTRQIIQLAGLIQTGSILLRGHMAGIITQSVQVKVKKIVIIILMELLAILVKKTVQKTA